MKVLVTGGTGLVGYAFVPELRSLGHAVVAPSRNDLDLTGARAQLVRAVRKAWPAWGAANAQ